MHCGATRCCCAASAAPPDRAAPFRGDAKVRGDAQVRGAAWSHRAKDLEGMLCSFPPSLYLLFCCLGLFVPVSVLGMNCLLCVCVLWTSSLLRSRCITCHGLCMCRCCCECGWLYLLMSMSDHIKGIRLISNWAMFHLWGDVASHHMLMLENLRGHVSLWNMSTKNLFWTMFHLLCSLYQRGQTSNCTRSLYLKLLLYLFPKMLWEFIWCLTVYSYLYFHFVCNDRVGLQIRTVHSDSSCHDSTAATPPWSNS